MHLQYPEWLLTIISSPIADILLTPHNRHHIAFCFGVRESQSRRKTDKGLQACAGV